MDCILKDVTCFCQGLAKAQEILNRFSVDFATKVQSLGGQIDSLSTITESLRLSESTPSADLVNGEIGQWQTILTACKAEVEKNIKGREFQNRFQKHPLVIVFGIVKAGKSTLGNFLHGRSFRAADFDNPYRNGQIPQTTIYVEESGRKDSKTKDAFDEASIESTCSAQYFQIPGLVWVDTPGIGAVQKAAIDIRPLEEIAKQYVQYADLVVFLANSANPGINEDVAGYKSLYENGKKALVVITRSDVFETAKDEKGRLLRSADGKIAKVQMPKDAQRRKMQEDALKQAMARNGVPADMCDAVSISTQLAEKGVADRDDELWKGGNLGSFYRKVVDIIGDEQILELKKQAPQKLLNTTIESIVGTAEKNNTLMCLLVKLDELKRKLQAQFDSLEPKGELVAEIAGDVVNQVRGPLRKYMDSELNKAEGADSVTFSLEGMQTVICEKVVATLEMRVKRLIGEFRRDSLSEFTLSDVSAQASRKKAKESYTVDVPYSVERDPEGFIENVRGFLGKKYRRTEIRSEKRTYEVDLGVDTSTAKESILSQIESSVETYVRGELEGLRTAFFGETLKKMTRLESSVRDLVTNLKKLRYA